MLVRTLASVATCLASPTSLFHDVPSSTASCCTAHGRYSAAEHASTPSSSLRPRFSHSYEYLATSFPMCCVPRQPRKAFPADPRFHRHLCLLSFSLSLFQRPLALPQIAAAPGLSSSTDGAPLLTEKRRRVAKHQGYVIFSFHHLSLHRLLSPSPPCLSPLFSSLPRQPAVFQ